MDMLKDNVRRLFFSCLAATVGSALIDSVFSILDAVMIGRYHGPSGSAVLSVFGPVWAAAYSIGLMSAVGGSALYGNARGRDDQESAREYFTLTLVFGGVFCVLVLPAMGLFRTPMLRFFGADETILSLCLQYLSPVFFAVPCTVFITILAAFLRNDGAPILPSRAVIAGGCVHILGDYLLIFRLDLGILGAGIALAAGLFTNIAVMMTHFFSKKNTLRLTRVRWSKLPGLVRTGFPSAVNDLALGIIAIILNRQIRRYLDIDALAAYGIMIQIAITVQSAAYGIAQAAQPILSANYGAGSHDRVRTCLRYGIWTSFALGAAVTAVIFGIPDTLVSWFTTPTQHLLETAPRIIRAYSLSFLFLPFNIFAAVFFQAIMKERVAAAASLARSVVISGILALLLPLLFGAGSLFYAIPLTELLVCGFLLFSIKKTETEWE